MNAFIFLWLVVVLVRTIGALVQNQSFLKTHKRIFKAWNELFGTHQSGGVVFFFERHLF